MRAYKVILSNNQEYVFWADDEQHAIEQGIDAEHLGVVGVEEIPTIHAIVMIQKEPTIANADTRYIMNDIQQQLCNSHFAIVKDEQIIAWAEFGDVILNEKL